MKVAVSLADSLFREAEAVARRRCGPQRQLDAKAQAVFVRQRSAEDTTAQLDAVAGRLSTEDRAPVEGPGLEVVRRERW